MQGKKSTSKINLKILVIAASVYIVSSLVSFFIFNEISKNSSSNIVSTVSKDASGNPVFDPSLPKTQSCPLNGAKYSKQQESWWKKHRPLGVMIENHIEARPQSGLTSADIVYEAVAEGGITRFLAMYYCQDAEVVGAVRSARTYFLDFVSEYGKNPLYAHVGGANTPGPANALGQIVDYGWAEYNDLNQFSIGFPVFVRDYDRMGRTVATEHTVYSSSTKLWEYAAKARKITTKDDNGDKWDENFTTYNIKDDAKLEERPTTQSISLSPWTGYQDYSVNWEYDRATNSYKRINGGKPHTDLNNKQQIAAKNVVVLFMKESRANDGYQGNLHMIYGTKGSGKAIVFIDGKEIPATWSKKDRASHLFIKDTKGQEIELNPGLIWFTVVSPDTKIGVN